VSLSLASEVDPDRWWPAAGVVDQHGDQPDDDSEEEERQGLERAA
jgi:hypothetical protein